MAENKKKQVNEKSNGGTNTPQFNRLNPIYLLAGPDGKISSKRTYGWAMFIVMIFYIFYMGEAADFEFVMLFCGASLTALGISSFDAYKFHKSAAEVKIEKVKAEKKEEEKTPEDEWWEWRRRRAGRGGYNDPFSGGYFDSHDPYNSPPMNFPMPSISMDSQPQGKAMGVGMSVEDDTYGNNPPKPNDSAYSQGPKL